MGHIEVVGLRAGGRDMLAELRASRDRGRLDDLVVIADPDDLGGALLEPVEAGDERGRELHRPALAIHVRPLHVADVPVGTPVDPDAEAERLHQRDDRGHHLRGNDLLFDDGHIRVDDETTVEGGEFSGQRQGLDDHGHAAWWSPAGHREEDACVVELVDRADGAVGEDLVVRDQSAVDVGKKQADRGGRHHASVSSGRGRSGWEEATAHGCGGLWDGFPVGLISESCWRIPSRPAMSRSRVPLEQRGKVNALEGAQCLDIPLELRYNPVRVMWRI